MPRRSPDAFVNVTGLPTRLAPPPELTSEEREIFVDLVSSVRAEHFRAGDLPLLTAYTRAVLLERRSFTELAAGDKTAQTRWNGAIKGLVALSMRLRLSPQSRQPNNPGRPGARAEPQLSVYDRMALERGYGDDDSA